MGYKNLTIEIDCSDIGDGCHVTLRNPQMAEYTDVVHPAIEDLAERNRVLVARFITEWEVWDRETGDPLPVPSTTENPGEVMRRVPAIIAYRIDAAVGKGLIFESAPVANGTMTSSSL